MKVVLSREVIEDTDADASYLEQEGFEQRLHEYRCGAFGFVGVRAVAKLLLPTPGDGHHVLHTIKSGGLWAIESDSGEDYLAEVYLAEQAELKEMLATIQQAEFEYLED